MNKSDQKFGKMRKNGAFSLPFKPKMNKNMNKFI